MVNINTMYEYVGDGRSPSQANFTMRNSSVTRTWYIPNPNGPGINEAPGLIASDLQLLPQQILGTTSTSIGEGGLSRQLPLADGLYPWMYAESINGLRGIGLATQEPPQLSTNTASLPGYALFQNYELTVTCTDRKYPVSPDTAIVSATVNWTDAENTSQATPYWREWERFVDLTFDPKDQWIEQQRGASYFETFSGLEPGNGQTTQQSIMMMMPDNILRLLWVGVPFRYVMSPNSYLTRFRGRINQFEWAGPPGAAEAGLSPFTAGSLLYIGFKPTIYNPVNPVLGTIAGNTISYSKLCDIEMFFLHTSREGDDLEASVGNVIRAGWNLQPYLPHRAFYYIYSLDLAGLKFPPFYSFPVEILFSDPDAPGAYTGAG